MFKKLITACFIASGSIMLTNCSNETPLQATVQDEGANTTAYVQRIDKLFALSSDKRKPYTPALVMSTCSLDIGNMEIVRRNGSGKLEALWWNPKMSNWSYGGNYLFGSNVISDPALCTNLNDDYLQVVVRESSNSSKLVHYWRNRGTQKWVRQTVFGNYFGGSPAMLCNESTKNLEVLCRRSDSRGIIHCTRKNGSWSTNYEPDLNELGYENGGEKIISDPTMAQYKSGSNIYLFVAFYTKSINTSKTYIYYLNVWKKKNNGRWAEAYRSDYATIDKECDISVKPAITTFGNSSGDVVSVLTKSKSSSYRLKELVGTLTDSYTFRNSNTIPCYGAGTAKYLSIVKKNTTTQYLFAGTNNCQYEVLTTTF